MIYRLNVIASLSFDTMTVPAAAPAHEASCNSAKHVSGTASSSATGNCSQSAGRWGKKRGE